MSEYKSQIKLDEEYVDTKTQIKGQAVGIYFYQYGCTRVTLELVVRDEIKEYTFEEPRLDGNLSTQVYPSDIELGKRYRDTQTGLEGIATAIYFYPNSCERVTIEYPHKGEVKAETFDAPRLMDFATGKPAQQTKTGGPGDLPTGRGHEMRSTPSRR